MAIGDISSTNFTTQAAKDGLSLQFLLLKALRRVLQTGDYNNDGVVNAADYTVWRDHLGQTFQLTNECTGITAGMVTAEDYTLWKANFGLTGGPTAGNNIPHRLSRLRHICWCGGGGLAGGRARARDRIAVADRPGRHAVDASTWIGQLARRTRTMQRITEQSNRSENMTCRDKSDFVCWRWLGSPPRC